MNKKLAAAGVALALAGGGVGGAMLGAPVGAGAAEDTAATAPATDGARPPGPGRFGHGPHGPRLDAVAEALGITVEELRTELEDGSTIAEVAAEKGVDVDTVIDALVAEARERITAFVNGERPEPPGPPTEATSTS